VAIQDGGPPLHFAELISKTIAAAREMGASVAAQRVTDTIKHPRMAPPFRAISIDTSFGPCKPHNLSRGGNPPRPNGCPAGRNGSDR